MWLVRVGACCEGTQGQPGVIKQARSLCFGNESAQETLLRNNYGCPFKIWKESTMERMNSKINIFENTKSPVADRMISLYL